MEGCLIASYVKEVAICGIVLIVCVGLYYHMNGVLTSSAFTIIGGIAGYSIGRESIESSRSEERGEVAERGEDG